MELWNSTLELGSAGQKAPADFVTEIAADRPARVVMQQVGGDCALFVPFRAGSNAGWASVPRDADLPFNARAGANGLLEESY